MAISFSFSEEFWSLLGYILVFLPPGTMQTMSPSSSGSPPWALLPVAPEGEGVREGYRWGWGGRRFTRLDFSPICLGVIIHYTCVSLDLSDSHFCFSLIFPPLYRCLLFAVLRRSPSRRQGLWGRLLPWGLSGPPPGGVTG